MRTSIAQLRLDVNGCERIDGVCASKMRSFGGYGLAKHLRMRLDELDLLDPPEPNDAEYYPHDGASGSSQLA